MSRLYHSFLPTTILCAFLITPTHAACQTHRTPLLHHSNICICIYLFRPIIIHMIADSSFIIPFRQVTLFTEPTHTIYADKFIKLGWYMLEHVLFYNKPIKLCCIQGWCVSGNETTPRHLSHHSVLAVFSTILHTRSTLWWWFLCSKLGA